MPQDPSRRESLLKAKLRALARSHWGAAIERAREGTLPGGAALATPDAAWVLGEDDPSRSLGPAIAWARKAGSARLHILVPSDAETLARRAERFSYPIEVWRIAGTSVERAGPEPLPVEPAVDPQAEAFRGLLERAGTEVVVEQGMLRAEVLGLEVARVVPDETGVHLEVGVGKHDRDAHSELSGQRQGMDELFEVVRAVADLRRSGRAGGDGYTLASERWLRAVVVKKPELVGARDLTPAPTPVARTDLRRSVPAPARGTDLEGRPLLVVFAVGLDLDVVSVASDAWAADERDPRLVICLPAADAYGVIRELAALHIPPAEVVTVPGDWRAL